METTQPKLNVKLLRRVKRHILAKPRRFIMLTYRITGKPNTAIHGDFNHSQRLESCGTAACIAGWVNIFTGNAEADYHEQPWLAQKALGITYEESFLLFGVHRWPEP